MDKVLENIMIFINENTNILIGICLFLIFVLIGYLIDNSIKSRRAKKDFKKSQSDVNIELEKTNDESLSEIKIDNSVFENAVENQNIEKIEDEIQTIDSNIENNNVIEPTFENIMNSDVEDATKSEEEHTTINDIINVIDDKTVEEPKNDNIETVENEAEVIYKNDKKLSEILFGDVNNNDNIDNIFSDKSSASDIKPKNVEPKVEVELDEDELDNIMKKLQNVSSLDEEDNYTNIF